MCSLCLHFHLPHACVFVHTSPGTWDRELCLPRVPVHKWLPVLSSPEGCKESGEKSDAVYSLLHSCSIYLRDGSFPAFPVSVTVCTWFLASAMHFRKNYRICVNNCRNLMLLLTKILSIRLSPKPFREKRKRHLFFTWQWMYVAGNYCVCVCVCECVCVCVCVRMCVCAWWRYGGSILIYYQIDLKMLAFTCPPHHTLLQPFVSAQIEEKSGSCRCRYCITVYSILVMHYICTSLHVIHVILFFPLSTSSSPSRVGLARRHL